MGRDDEACVANPFPGVRSVDCNEVLQQLAEYLDDDARVELCREIEAHLTQCPDCQIEVDSVKKTIVLYQHDRVVDTPPAVSKSLEAALAREYQMRAD